MSLYFGNKPIANDGLQRLTGEIGDIGIAPLGIDESLNLRRYLNGQVISQTQFEAFTNKVKSAIALYPNLEATEENWQAEVTASVLGQCGKFVVDDENQTIRLPAVVNAQGLLGLSSLGNLVNESLPNISGDTGFARNVSGGGWASTYNPSGCFYQASTRVGDGLGSSSTDVTAGVLGFDASRSSTAYQDNAPVQQEAIQYPYYIQVATGIEETLPAIREYGINTPFFFGQSMWTDVDPNNASWLLSNAQWNSKSVYPDYYVWLVSNLGKDHIKGMIGYAFKKPNEEVRWWTAKRNPEIGDVVFGADGIRKLGVVNQVNSDGTIGFYEEAISLQQDNLIYTESENINVDGTGFDNIVWANDYDWIINTTDETFRLPLLNGEEDLPGTEMTFSIFSAITTTLQTYTCPTNGFVFVTCAHNTGTLTITCNGSGASSNGSGHSDNRESAYFFAKKGDVITAQLNAGTQVSTSSYFLKAIGNGTLYYYVGDTVQDASLINAGRALNDIAELKGHAIIETYRNGTEWYRIYADGWCEQGGVAGGANVSNTITLLKPYKSINYHVSCMTMTNEAATFSSCACTTESGGFTSSQFTVIQAYAGGAKIGRFVWKASGYIS